MILILENLTFWIPEVNRAGAIENPEESHTPSNLASIGEYFFMPDIFLTFPGFSTGLRDTIELFPTIIIHLQQRSVQIARLNG